MEWGSKMGTWMKTNLDSVNIEGVVEIERNFLGLEFLGVVLQFWIFAASLNFKMVQKSQII